MKAIFCALILGALFFISNAKGQDEPQIPSSDKDAFEAVQNTLNTGAHSYKKYIELKDEIEGVISRNRGFFPAQMERVRILLNLSSVDKRGALAVHKDARRILNDVISSSPEYHKPYVLLAHIELLEGRIEEAQKFILKAQRLNQDDPWLHINLARVSLENKKNSEAAQHAKAAIGASKNNVNALVSAISMHAIALEGKTINMDLTKTIYSLLAEQRSRLAAARGLMEQYGGKRELLSAAEQIVGIERAKSPNDESVLLELSRLYLTKGYRKTVNMINEYDEESRLNAEKILVELWPRSKRKEDVFELLSLVLLSEARFNELSTLLKDAKASGVAESALAIIEASSWYAKRNYKKVVEILELAAKEDPFILLGEMLANSYGYLGDVDAVKKYHQRQIAGNPFSAWSYGNYASFLVERTDDYSEAIVQGEKALSLMNYPMARNVTGLAYLIRAATEFKAGRHAVAKDLRDKAWALEPSFDFMIRRCKKYCSDIGDLEKAMSVGGGGLH